MSETPIHPCPVCSTPCIVAGGEDEPGPGGTRHYVPVVGDMARLREAVDQLARLAGPGSTTAAALGIIERLKATEGSDGG